MKRIIDTYISEIVGNVPYKSSLSNTTDRLLIGEIPIGITSYDMRITNTTFSWLNSNNPEVGSGIYVRKEASFRDMTLTSKCCVDISIYGLGISYIKDSDGSTTALTQLEINDTDGKFYVSPVITNSQLTNRAIFYDNPYASPKIHIYFK